MAPEPPKKKGRPKNVDSSEQRQYRRNLALMMKRQNIDQDDLADLVGVTQQAASKFLIVPGPKSRPTKITAEWIKRFADALNYKPGAFYEEVDPGMPIGPIERKAFRLNLLLPRAAIGEELVKRAEAAIDALNEEYRLGCP